MLEIRLHGRGGQGAVTSAELVAIAAIGKGNFAQAFPSFGPERRGAPVVAFCRVDAKKINIRAKVYSPDVVIVLDPGLLTPEMAVGHPNAHVIRRFIGSPNPPEVDFRLRLRPNLNDEQARDQQGTPLLPGNIFTGRYPIEAMQEERLLEYERLVRDGRLDGMKRSAPGMIPQFLSSAFGLLSLILGLFLTGLIFWGVLFY